MRNNIIMPKHIGVIMDGNGRWAKQRGLERSEGHKAGANTFRAICDYAAEIGLECVTFYAFSTENWSRPKAEVDGLMDLLVDNIVKETPTFHKNNIRFTTIGDNAFSGCTSLTEITVPRSNCSPPYIFISSGLLASTLTEP